MKRRLKLVAAGILCSLVVAACLFFTRDIRYMHKVENIYNNISLIRYAKAYLLCEEAVRMCPDRVEAYVAYARLNAAKGDKPQTEARLLQIISQAKDRYEKKGQVLEGIDEAVLVLAQYYVMWNRTEDACELIRKVPEAFCSDAVNQYLLQLTGMPVELEQDYVIEWKDKAFESMIRKMLDMPQGDIMASKVWYINELQFWGNVTASAMNPVTVYDKEGFYWNGSYYNQAGTIQTLDDLVHFANIESISINYQQKLSLGFFETNQPARLRKLSLIADGIEDIRPLMWATNLTTLNVSCNHIRDFMWISRLYELNTLYAGNNEAFDSSELLESLEKLAWLDASGMKKVNIERITELPNLVTLILDEAEDVSELPFCASLENLTIKTDAVGLGFVERVYTLVSLKLEVHSQLSLENLSGLGNLEELTVSSAIQEPVDIGVVSEIPNLHTLTLGQGLFTGYEYIARTAVLEQIILDYGDDEKYQQIVRYISDAKIKHTIK